VVLMFTIIYPFYSNVTTNGVDLCTFLSNRGDKQPVFAQVGKYAIIVLAAWNLLREVSLLIFYAPRKF